MAAGPAAGSARRRGAAILTLVAAAAVAGVVAAPAATAFVVEGPRGATPPPPPPPPVRTVTDARTVATVRAVMDLRGETILPRSLRYAVQLEMFRLGLAAGLSSSGRLFVAPSNVSVERTDAIDTRRRGLLVLTGGGGGRRGLLAPTQEAPGQEAPFDDLSLPQAPSPPLPGFTDPAPSTTPPMLGTRVVAEVHTGVAPVVVELLRDALASGNITLALHAAGLSNLTAVGLRSLKIGAVVAAGPPLTTAMVTASGAVLPYSVNATALLEAAADADADADDERKPRPPGHGEITDEHIVVAVCIAGAVLIFLGAVLAALRGRRPAGAAAGGSAPEDVEAKG